MTSNFPTPATSTVSSYEDALLANDDAKKRRPDLIVNSLAVQRGLYFSDVQNINIWTGASPFDVRWVIPGTVDSATLAWTSGTAPAADRKLNNYTGGMTIFSVTAPWPTDLKVNGGGEAKLNNNSPVTMTLEWKGVTPNNFIMSSPKFQPTTDATRTIAFQSCSVEANDVITIRGVSTALNANDQGVFRILIWLLDKA